MFNFSKLGKNSFNSMVGSTGPAPGPQATAFLARTSGLSTIESNAYINLINGLVADGNFALLDALYIFATNTTTTANLNLISTSFGLTKTGTVNFSADHGYTGDGSTGYLDTGFVPATAGGNFVQNSASLGVYILTNRLTSALYAAIGTGNGGFNEAYIYPWYTDNNAYFAINDSSGSNSAAVIVKGMWLVSRTATAVEERYLNGSPNLAATGNSVAPASLSVVIGARRDGASGVPSDFSADQLSAAFVGGGLNATQAGKVSTRINDYMTALGINVY